MMLSKRNVILIKQRFLPHLIGFKAALLKNFIENIFHTIENIKQEEKKSINK